MSHSFFRNDDENEKAEVEPKRKRLDKHDSDDDNGGEDGMRVRSSKR